MMDYYPPQIDKTSFHCPHCGVYARQNHFRASPQMNNVNAGLGYVGDRPIHCTVCEHCSKVCLWHEESLVYPNRGSAPAPNPDMPENVKKDYEEAARIYTQSPRGAAALVRLAIQKLANEIGTDKKNLNENIAAFVKGDLPKKTQKALDAVRVIGNNAVHPGQIDTDNENVAASLFFLTNLIVESMITMPGRVDEIYDSLPESAKDAIDKRDDKSS